MKLEELLERLFTQYRQELPDYIDCDEVFKGMAKAVASDERIPEKFLEMTLRHQAEAEKVFGADNVYKYMEYMTISARLGAGTKISELLKDHAASEAQP